MCLPLRPIPSATVSVLAHLEVAGSTLSRLRRHLSLQDTSDGCGSKFEAIIVSSKFEGVPLLERQQLVNSIIAEEMATIHAFSMKTWTPEQFAKKQAAASS